MTLFSSRMTLGLFAAAIAGVLSLGTAANAASVKLIPGHNEFGSVELSWLVEGNSAIVGDKEFSNFQYVNTGGNVVTAENVLVLPLGTGVGDDHLGIRFMAAGGFNDAPDGTATVYQFRYTVSVLDPGYVITDAHLDSNVWVVARTMPNPAAVASITETFTAVIPPAPELAGIVLENWNSNNENPILHDEVVFRAGYKVIDVVKDVILNAGAIQLPEQSGLPYLTIEYIDQRFSQKVVPLPAAVWTGLSMLGGVGVLGVMRRRRNPVVA